MSVYCITVKWNFFYLYMYIKPEIYQCVSKPLR